MSFFDFEWNKPCICGSGKKFKKCCLFTLESIARKWDKEKWYWMHQELPAALALVCGLPPKAEEVIPSIPAIEEALEYLTEKYFPRAAKTSRLRLCTI